MPLIHILWKWKLRTKGGLVRAELSWVRQAHLQIALEKDEGIDKRGRMVQTETVEACASQCDTSASLQILLTFQDAQCESIFFGSQWRDWVLHWVGKGKWLHKRIQEHGGRQAWGSITGNSTVYWPVTSVQRTDIWASFCSSLSSMGFQVTFSLHVGSSAHKCIHFLSNHITLVISF